MQLIRNPVIGWNTLPREYSAGSISNSSSTAGVIHPPHGLLRGKPCLSRIVTSMPECRNFQAQEEPARSEEHTSELQSLAYLVCRLLLEKKKTRYTRSILQICTRF